MKSKRVKTFEEYQSEDPEKCARCGEKLTDCQCKREDSHSTLDSHIPNTEKKLD